MPRTKKTETTVTKRAPRKRNSTASLVEQAPEYTSEPPIYTQRAKECCDNCGKCENCLHPAGNIKNYTPLLMLLLLISSFLLGMLLTRVGAFDNNNLAGYTPPTTNTTNQQAGAPVKPLHVAQAIGMNADAFKKCLDSGKYTQQVAADLAEGQKDGVTGTPAIFIDGLSIVGAQPYSVFKSTIDQELATAQIKDNFFVKLANALVVPAIAQTDTTAPTQDISSPTPPARVDVTLGQFPVLGNANAKVTIVEFADFQCPFCEQFYKDSEPSIINDYVKSGKVKFAFRNYAFLGQESNVAAEGAYCANDQGKFWAYHNFLYDHQGQENSGQFTKENLE